MSDTTLTAEQLDDLAANGVDWDVSTLLGDNGSVDSLLDAADAITVELETTGRGRIAAMSAAEIVSFFQRYADLAELMSRAGNYANLTFAQDTRPPEHGALLAHVEERSTAISSRLLFIELEWSAAPVESAEAILDDPSASLNFVRHFLRSVRRYQPHQLSEPEEKILTEKDLTGASAWHRLYDELSAAITVSLPGPDGAPSELPLAMGLARLQDPDREQRQAAHQAVTVALQPGLRTRGFIYNTLLSDRSVDDRLRSYPRWDASRHLSNEASPESVQALVDAVVGRYDIPQRWYALKAAMLGLDKIADYDRMASVASSDEQLGWAQATESVVDAYASFSGELAGIVQRFLREGWIDAPNRPGKRPGAFCAYTVPSHHPYVLLNWSSRPRSRRARP